MLHIVKECSFFCLKWCTNIQVLMRWQYWLSLRCDIKKIRDSDLTQMRCQQITKFSLNGKVVRVIASLMDLIAFAQWTQVVLIEDKSIWCKSLTADNSVFKTCFKQYSCYCHLTVNTNFLRGLWEFGKFQALPRSPQRPVAVTQKSFTPAVWVIQEFFTSGSQPGKRQRQFLPWNGGTHGEKKRIMLSSRNFNLNQISWWCLY